MVLKKENHLGPNIDPVHGQVMWLNQFSGFSNELFKTKRVILYCFVTVKRSEQSLLEKIYLDTFKAKGMFLSRRTL